MRKLLNMGSAILYMYRPIHLRLDHPCRQPVRAYHIPHTTYNTLHLAATYYDQQDNNCLSMYPTSSLGNCNLGTV